MKPLTIAYYFPNSSTHSKTVQYEFNANDLYNNEQCLSITRSSKLTFKSGQDKKNIFTVTKEEWPSFVNWIKQEVINPQKTKSKPCYLSWPDKAVKFSFNRDEKYKGSRFICIKKKETGVPGQLSYQNLAIAKDQWDQFKQWIREVIKEEPGF